jgi:hypothetical protein
MGCHISASISQILHIILGNDYSAVGETKHSINFKETEQASIKQCVTMKSTTIFCLLLGCWMYHIGLNEVVYQILL